MNQTIIIYGKPIAQKRPRFARRGKFVKVYSDQETEAGKFLLFAKNQIKQKHDAGTPLYVQFTFIFLRPMSHYGTGKNAGVLKDSAPRAMVTKPDLTNLEKFAEDVLNEFAWHDDSQICYKKSCKKYGSIARTEITIEPL